MKKEKRIIAGVAVLLIVIATVCGNFYNRTLPYDPSATDKYGTVFALPEGLAGLSVYQSGLVACDGGIALYYDEISKEIKVENRQTGYIWKSAVDGTDLKQLCSVTLINEESDNTVSLNSASNSCNISCKALKNGIELEHSFPEQGLSFSLQLWLEKGRLWVRLPIDSLIETQPFSVMSVDIMPYFGAADASEDGYIFFPDGTGALYEFNDKTVATSPLTLDVYSDRVIDVDAILNDRETGVHTARLPVYGIRRGNNAFTVFIADGAESSSVTLEPAGYVCNKNRVYGTAVYRKVTEVVSESGISSYQSDGRIGLGDFSASYMFLSGEESDYSGMAHAVREFMLEYGLLKNSVGNDIGLKLDVVMGAREKTMLGSSYRKVTDVKQLSEMLKEIDFSGRTVAVLLGWQTQGYGVYPDTGKASGAIGSLKKLEKPDNTDVYLGFTACLAKNGQNGAVLRRDGIRNSKRITVIGEKSETYIINANAQLNLFQRVLPRLKDCGDYGILMGGAGSILYDDYNKKAGMTRRQTANSLCALLEKAAESGPLMIEEPNSYALKYADFVSGVYQNASGYHLLGRQVPFVPLVISGSVRYSLDIAGNLSSSFDITRLRWAEYGAVPYFVLSADGSEALSNTPADAFFSMDFGTQKELVKKTAEEFQALRMSLGNAVLQSHTRVAEGLYRSDFENGASVYVNYADSEATIDGIIIPAMDFAVKGGVGK